MTRARDLSEVLNEVTSDNILDKVKTVDGSGSGLDADTVDGLQASQFLRSDADDSTSGVISSLRLNSSALNLNGYQNWDVGGYDSTGGGAAIVNDNGSYKALMILGNRSAGGVRIVKVWDTLDVQGTLVESSDARLKENIETLKNPLNKILSLRGVSYNKIESPDKPEIGFIAQEVEEVVPEIVTTDDTEEGMKAVSYGRAVALLVEAMKEQQQMIDDLKKLVEELKND